MPAKKKGGFRFMKSVPDKVGAAPRELAAIQAHAVTSCRYARRVANATAATSTS
jgi:hypothetical protein